LLQRWVLKKELHHVTPEAIETVYNNVRAGKTSGEKPAASGDADAAGTADKPALMEPFKIIKGLTQ
jgi:hypothetical protein